MRRGFSIVLALLSGCLAQETKPVPTIAELETAAQVSYLHGDYEAAHQSLLLAWDQSQLLPPEDPVRYDVLKRMAGVRAAVSEFADADNFQQQAIAWRESTLGPNDPKLVDDLLLSAGYARGLKDFERALQIMNRVRNLHMLANRTAGMDPGNLMSSLDIADDFSRTAQIQAEMGVEMAPAAIVSLTAAIGIRTKILGPLEPLLVYDLDRLAGLQVVTRAYDKAENTYRHALAIRETLYGKVHADLITTVDGLAYALFGEKKYDDAEPMYKRLLELWIASIGTEKHPMVAVTLDKIAVFYSAQKKWDDARTALTRANAIRAFLLADGLSNEASERVDEGKMAEAVPLYQRAVNVLDPPDPIYEQQRAQIASQQRTLEQLIKKPPAPTPTRIK